MIGLFGRGRLGLVGFGRVFGVGLCQYRYARDDAYVC